MSTTRITINIDDEILPILEKEAEKRKIARAHTAGEIIRLYFTSDSGDEDTKYSEYESKIQYYESEIRELRADKIWLQGEVSKMNDGLISKLPEGKFKISSIWPWNKKR